MSVDDVAVLEERRWSGSSCGWWIGWEAVCVVLLLAGPAQLAATTALLLPFAAAAALNLETRDGTW